MTAAITLQELLQCCPYRSLIGAETGLPDRTFAVLGGDPTPINPEMMMDLVQVIRGGGRVLLLSDRTDLRDRAKREIVGLLQPPAGQA